jgi:hypothetical protein
MHHDLHESGRRGECEHRALPRDISHHQLIHHPTSQWHAAAQAGVAQTLPERLADRFLRRPQLEKGGQLIRLGSHPLELRRIEPSLGQPTDAARVDLLEVHAEGTVVRRGDRDEVVRMTHAHRETGNVRSPSWVVGEDRVVDERASEGD